MGAQQYYFSGKRQNSIFKHVIYYNVIFETGSYTTLFNNTLWILQRWFHNFFKRPWYSYEAILCKMGNGFDIYPQLGKKLCLLNCPSYYCGRQMPAFAIDFINKRLVRKTA
jgi:hypothetical protein